MGGFVPVVLHDSDRDPLPAVDRELDESAWRTLLANLDRIAERARERGIGPALHPHVGTVVENRVEVERVLEGSTVPLCLDTGHLLIGGTDPVELASAVPGRIDHTHLKDVNVALAEEVRAGKIAHTDAVRNGIYRPLGQGDIDIAGIIELLESHGFQGWYVMEQDTILTDAPEGEGPVADVRASVAYLRELDRNKLW